MSKRHVSSTSSSANIKKHRPQAPCALPACLAPTCLGEVEEVHALWRALRQRPAQVLVHGLREERGERRHHLQGAAGIAPIPTSGNQACGIGCLGAGLPGIMSNCGQGFQPCLHRVVALLMGGQTWWINQAHAIAPKPCMHDSNLGSQSCGLTRTEQHSSCPQPRLPGGRALSVA